MSKGKIRYPFYRPKFWSKYYIHMRPYLLFISGIAGLTGMALIKEPNMTHVVIAMFPFFLSYGIGQALTDVFQIDTDSISSPYRPLVKGEISRSAVFTVSLIGLSIGVLVLAYINTWLLIPGALAIIGLATYTPFKRTWWGGPPWNSWIVALLPLMGRMVDTEFHPTEHLFPVSEAGAPLVYAMAAIFFAYANFVVGGYFKDISADRQTNYQTIQVRFGWTAGAVCSDILALLAALFTGLAIWPVVQQGTIAGYTSVSVLGLIIVVNGLAQIGLHGTRDENETHGPIARIVRSFIAYCMIIITAYKFEWWPVLVVYYIVFELTLHARPARSQI